MKKYLFAVVFLFLGLSVPVAHAYITPTLSLSSVSATSGRVTVYGDPSASVDLHYGPSASLTAQLGTTDQAGNLIMPFSLDGYAVSCGNTAYVVVNGQQSVTIPWSLNPASCTTSSPGGLYFSQNNVVINVGQSQAVIIYGSGTYSITNISNPSVISTSLTDNTLTISAVTFGGSNITVCQSANQCATISVVAVNSNNSSSNNNNNQQNNSNLLPALSSFMVSSDNLNGKFIATGNTLTLTFNGNKPLSNVVVRVGSSQVSVAGGGSGPYTSTYKVTGGEGSLIPVLVMFNDASGNPAQSTFALGNAAAVATPAPVVPAPAPASPPPSAPSSSSGSYTFSSFLSLNSTGEEVTALQKRLTALGFYSGPITGKFGSLTEAAVKKFQKSHGLTQAGYVGPSTRAVLNK